MLIYTKSCSDTPLKIKEELQYKSLRWKGLRRKLKRGFLEADLVLEARHLFPHDTYPHLSTNLENLIPINQTLNRAYHKWARENNKGRKGLGDYDSFWIFVEQYYSNKVIRNNIQEVKKKFPAPQ